MAGSSSSNPSLSDISSMAKKHEEQRLALNLARDAAREAESRLKASEGQKAVAANKLRQALEEKQRSELENAALVARVKELEASLEISDDGARRNLLEKQSIEKRLHALQKAYEKLEKENADLRKGSETWESERKTLEASCKE